MLVLQCVSKSVCWCFDALVRHVGALVHWCVGVLVCQCVGALVCWCIGALVH